MRSFAFATLFSILVIGTPMLHAYADSDVLVPDDTSKGTPDLGLTPSPAPSTTPPSTSYAPPPSTSITPPTLSTSSFPPTFGSGSAQPGSTAEAIQAAINRMPHTTLSSSSATRVVNMPDPLIGQNTAWNNIDVSVDPKWKPRSTTLVTNRLGIRDTDVASMCQISVDGIIRTDKTPATFDTGTATHITTRYTGKMSAVVASVKALCSEADPLPTNKGTIFQVGDKYAVALGIAQCKPSDPSKPIHGISISFADEGMPLCTAQ